MLPKTYKRLPGPTANQSLTKVQTIFLTSFPKAKKANRELEGKGKQNQMSPRPCSSLDQTPPPPPGFAVRASFASTVVCDADDAVTTSTPVRCGLTHSNHSALPPPLSCGWLRAASSCDICNESLATATLLTRGTRAREHFGLSILGLPDDLHSASD